MKEWEPEAKDAASVLAVVLICAAVFWVFSSYQEACAYERVTGHSVTTWDAMWIELRVQGGASK